MDIIEPDAKLEALITAQTGIQATADKTDEEIQKQLNDLTNFLEVGSSLLSRQ
jgi:hypothetical protein